MNCYLARFSTVFLNPYFNVCALAPIYSLLFLQEFLFFLKAAKGAD